MNKDLISPLNIFKKYYEMKINNLNIQWKKEKSLCGVKKYNHNLKCQQAERMGVSKVHVLRSISQKIPCITSAAIINIFVLSGQTTSFTFTYQLYGKIKLHEF